jgi:hypothetical protein
MLDYCQTEMRAYTPITVVTVLFQPGRDVPDHSRCYGPGWVDKLYRGIRRWTHHPFEMVCLVDRAYAFSEPITKQLLRHTRWQDVLLQAYAVEGERLAFMGLDTVITGDLDELFSYDGPLAVPVDPYRPGHACSGFVLCPPRPDLAALHGNDMLALDTVSHDWLDERYPGQVVSYKGQVRDHGLSRNTRVVYFHGTPKPHELHDAWVQEAWC